MPLGISLDRRAGTRRALPAESGMLTHDVVVELPGAPARGRRHLVGEQAAVRVERAQAPRPGDPHAPTPTSTRLAAARGTAPPRSRPRARRSPRPAVRARPTRRVLLDRAQAELLEPRHLRRRELLVGELRVRAPAPQRQRLLESRRRILGPIDATPDRPAPDSSNRSASTSAALDPQPVTRRHGLDPVRTQRARGGGTRASGACAARSRGGTSPQSTSISRSADTTSFACIARRASTRRCCGLPSRTGSPPRTTSSGPSTDSDTGERSATGPSNLGLRTPPRAAPARSCDQTATTLRGPPGTAAVEEPNPRTPPKEEP